jgi:hypothetical protein
MRVGEEVDRCVGFSKLRFVKDLRVSVAETTQSAGKTEKISNCCLLTPEKQNGQATLNEKMFEGSGPRVLLLSGQ